MKRRQMVRERGETGLPALDSSAGRFRKPRARHARRAIEGYSPELSEQPEGCGLSGQVAPSTAAMSFTTRPRGPICFGPSSRPATPTARSNLAWIDGISSKRTARFSPLPIPANRIAMRIR